MAGLTSPPSSSFCKRDEGERKRDAEAADMLSCPAEPMGEAGEGRLYNGGGEEGGHAGQDDNGAKVLDGLGGLHLLDQLLLVHIHTKAEEMLQTDGKEIEPD